MSFPLLSAYQTPPHLHAHLRLAYLAAPGRPTLCSLRSPTPKREFSYPSPHGLRHRSRTSSLPTPTPASANSLLLTAVKTAATHHRIRGRDYRSEGCPSSSGAQPLDPPHAGDEQSEEGCIPITTQHQCCIPRRERRSRICTLYTTTGGATLAAPASPSAASCIESVGQEWCRRYYLLAIPAGVQRRPT